MKLAFCLFKYFPFGGLQRNMLAIARECHRRGYMVEIFVGSWQGDKPEDISVHELEVSGFSNHARNDSFYQRFRRYRTTHSFDLVVGFNKMPGLDLYYAADSCFATKAYEMKGMLYRLTARSKKSLAFEASVFGSDFKTHILLVSEKEKPAFQRYYQTEDERFHSLPPGISRDRILPSNFLSIRQSFRTEMGIKQDQKALLALGSGFKTKGLDRSIAALAGLQAPFADSLLYVVGQDNPRQFQRQAEQLGISDRVVFFSGRDDVPRFLLGCDGLLHPAYRENTGNVLLEAMVSGLPVLTSDVCGYAHYVTEGEMGVVLDSPYNETESLRQLHALLAVERKEWFEKGKTFAATANVFHRPQAAADIIDGLIYQKMLAMTGE